MSILFDSIFPKYCSICKKLGSNLCDKCKNELELITFETCIVCDGPSINGDTHKACQNHLLPNRYISLCVYNKIARQIILKSKYGQKSYELLESLINIEENTKKIKMISGIDFIIPIPMTKSYKKRNDINHGLYIANQIGKIVKVPVIDALLKTSKRSQKSLSGDRRRYNLKGKIKLLNEDSSIFKGKSILLIDDVLTTGATMIESCRVLKLNGAKDVTCLTITKDKLDNV